MEYHPAPSRQLLPNNNAVGVQGMSWAIGVFYMIPEFGRSLSLKNSISWRIDLLMVNFWRDVPILLLSLTQRRCVAPVH